MVRFLYSLDPTHSQSADKEGVAIILCEAELETKYRNLAKGQTCLESSLHLNLSEHLNSEIGLGTIKSTENARDWIRSSFLYHRLKKNPKHYKVTKTEYQTWEDRIDDMVLDGVEKLQKSQLVKRAEEEASDLASTDFGEIMSKASSFFPPISSTNNLVAAILAPSNGIFFCYKCLPILMANVDEFNHGDVYSGIYPRYCELASTNA